MTKYFKFLIIIVSLTNCGQNNLDTKQTPNDTTKVSQTVPNETIHNDINYFRFGTNYVILTFHPNDTWLFPADSKPIDIVKTDEEIAFRLALQCIDSINVAQLKRHEELKKETSWSTRSASFVRYFTLLDMK